MSQEHGFLMDRDDGLTYSERMRAQGLCVGCGELPDISNYLDWQKRVWELFGWCAQCAATLDELNDPPSEERQSA